MHLRNKYLDYSSPHFRLRAHFNPADKNTCGANDRGPRHSTPTAQLQEPEHCRTWVFVCQCVRQLDSPQAHR